MRGLPDAQQLVRLEAEAPLRVGQAVGQGSFGIVARHLGISVIHRLKVERLEGESGKAFRLRIRLRLWIDELQLLALSLGQWRVRLWAHADVIDARRRGLSAIGLDRDLEAAVVQ